MHDAKEDSDRTYRSGRLYTTYRNCMARLHKTGLFPQEQLKRRKPNPSDEGVQF